MRTLPTYVALCGHPKAGKSLVQEILRETWGYDPVDDGRPMREFAVNNLGLTWDQVTTQEGKLEHVEILGRRWQVRELLGELGNRFEEMFGDHGIPHMAVERAHWMDRSGMSSATRYSFGSVRRDQGRYYQQRGGIVIGIENPQAGPSPYEFDRFDRDVVDYWIENDFLARGHDPERARHELAARVGEVMQQAAANLDRATRAGEALASAALGLVRAA